MLLVVIGIQIPMSAQIIRSQTSKWSNDLDGGNLTTVNEAGADLNSTLETTSNFNRVDVAGISTTQGWRVTVSKIDISWPAAFIPSVQRTSTGTPCGTCAGVNTGTSVTGYLQVTDVEQNFIFGTGTVNDINIQFKIDGITLAVPAGTYQTTVVFTLYGDP